MMTKKYDDTEVEITETFPALSLLYMHMTKLVFYNGIFGKCVTVSVCFCQPSTVCLDITQLSINVNNIYIKAIILGICTD